MAKKVLGVQNSDGRVATTERIAELQHRESLIKTGALQNAIFNSANFSSIATDENGVVQLFNVGAERMLGYFGCRSGE